MEDKGKRHSLSKESFIKPLSFRKVSKNYKSDYKLRTVLEKNRNYSVSHTDASVKRVMETLTSLNTIERLNANPEYQALQDENKKFIKDYKTAQKIIKKKNKKDDRFKEIIEEYRKRGYKIPDISVNHNLFKMCPLLEENRDRMTRGFLVEKIQNSKMPMRRKIVKYLNKLNILVTKQLHSDASQGAEYAANQAFLETQKNLISITLSANQNIDYEAENRAELEKIKILTDMIKNQTLETLEKEIKRSPIRYSSSKVSRMNFWSDKTPSTISARESTHKLTNYGQRKSRHNSFLLMTPRKEKREGTSYSLSNFSTAKTGQKVLHLKHQSGFKNSSSRNVQEFFGGTTTSGFYATKTTAFTNYNYNNFNVSDFNFDNESDFLEFAYKRLLNNDYLSVESSLIMYLKKYKDMTDEQINDYLCKYGHKVNAKKIYRDIKKLKEIVNRNKLEESNKRMYMTIGSIGRVKPLIKKMEKQDKIINGLDKRLSKGLAGKP